MKTGGKELKISSTELISFNFIIQDSRVCITQHSTIVFRLIFVFHRTRNSDVPEIRLWNHESGWDRKVICLFVRLSVQDIGTLVDIRQLIGISCRTANKIVSMIEKRALILKFIFNDAFEVRSGWKRDHFT